MSIHFLIRLLCSTQKNVLFQPLVCLYYVFIYCKCNILQRYHICLTRSCFIRLRCLIFIICFLSNSLGDNFNSLYFYRLNGQTNRPTDCPTNTDCSSFSCCKSWIWVFSVESPTTVVVTLQTKPLLDSSSTSWHCHSLSYSCLGSNGCLGASLDAQEPDKCLGSWWISFGNLWSLSFPEEKNAGPSGSNSQVKLDQNC